MIAILRKFALIFASLAAVTTGRAAIDFTPTVNRYQSEGAEYSSVSFNDDKRTISITLPRQWSCRGDSSRLQIIPPNEDFAEGVIQSVPTKGMLRFDEAIVKSLEERVLTDLPPGSQAAAIASLRENPVSIYQNLSYEFIVSYKTLGQTFQRSVIFVSCPDQLLVFKFSASKATFDSLNRSFRQSICSWEWTKTAALVGPKTASK